MMKLIDQTARGKTGSERRNQILAIARQLFLERGYDNVGMREIARSAGISPALIYREGWTKADLLAELILELNGEQIAQFRTLPLPSEGSTLDRVLFMLGHLYSFDIGQKHLRRLGAAYGWLWSSEQETRFVSQVNELLTPFRQLLSEAGLNPVEPRVHGIWAVYSASFRQAVFDDANATTCIEAIRPTVALLLAPA
jgi:Transcriptional regulator